MKKITLAAGITIIAIFVAVLVLLPHSTEAPQETLIETPEVATTTETGVASLASLSSLGNRLECEIQYRPTPQSEEIAGSYFIDGERVRGDFVLSEPTLGEIVSSFIIDSESVYIWSLIDGETYGVRTNVEAEAVDSDLPIPEDEPVRYSCRPWLQYDASIFNPPSDVLFRDPIDLQAEFGTIYEEGEF